MTVKPGLFTSAIEHDVVYPHPVERVWRAIATREGLRAWLMENDFEPRAGHRFRFTAKPIPGLWNGVTDAVVREIVPERRLVLEWEGQGGQPSTFTTWELDPVDGGTRLRFRHEGFQGLRGAMMRRGMSRGWHRMHASYIPQVVEQIARGESPTPVPGSSCHRRQAA